MLEYILGLAAFGWILLVTVLPFVLLIMFGKAMMNMFRR